MSLFFKIEEQKLVNISISSLSFSRLLDMYLSLPSTENIAILELLSSSNSFNAG